MCAREAVYENTPGRNHPEFKTYRLPSCAKPWDDKSKFLAKAGFGQKNIKRLEAAIRKLVDEREAHEDGNNAYGTFYRVEGSLIGPNGNSLHVILIWLQWKLDGTYHFVTLKPGERDDDQI